MLRAALLPRPNRARATQGGPLHVGTRPAAWRVRGVVPEAHLALDKAPEVGARALFARVVGELGEDEFALGEVFGGDDPFTNRTGRRRGRRERGTVEGEVGRDRRYVRVYCT